MARQTGSNPFTGRRGDLLGYRMAGQYYVRIISSLTAERVRNDAAFRPTMQYAGLLARASRIASAIYRLLPPGREHGFYRKLTGMAMGLLKQGKTGEEVFEQLCGQIIPPAPPVEALTEKKPVFTPSFADQLLEAVFSACPRQQETERQTVLRHSPP